jgi:hypothetical protein
MEPWVWIAGYVVGFSLLQVLVYRYLRDDDTRLERAATEPPETPPGAGSDLREEPSLSGHGNRISCPNCGARNDREQMVTYCWQCVQPLR